MKHLLILALVALPLVAVAGPKEDAQKHIAKATEAHQAGKYDVALTELQVAHALDPQPDLLYAMGQVQVKLGKCNDAIVSYEKFLATNPPTEPSNAAREAIDQCKAQAPAPTPEPAPAPTPAPAPEPTTPPQPKAFYTDKVGSALVGVGVVTMIVGVVMYASAVSTLDDAELQATTHEEHKQLVNEAEGRRNTGLIFGVIGVAATGIGVWHYTKFKREQTVTVAPTTSGGMVSWQGRF